MILDIVANYNNRRTKTYHANKFIINIVKQPVNLSSCDSFSNFDMFNSLALNLCGCALISTLDMTFSTEYALISN